MSRELVNLGLSLQALREQHPVDASTRRLVQIRPDALGLALCALPGDMGSCWGYALGTLTRDPKVFAVGDPRSFKQQREVLGKLGKDIAPYWRVWERTETAPQVVVASQAAMRLIETIVFRWGTADHLSDDERRAVTLLAFLADRGEQAGSQSVVVATSELEERWASGIDGQDRDSLAEQLRRHHVDVPAHPTHPDRVDLDVALCPGDEVDLFPHWSHMAMKYRSGTESGAGAAQGEAKKVVLPTIEALLAGRFARIRAAAAILAADDAPLLDGLGKIVEDDNKEWSWKLGGFNQGYRPGPNNTPKAAALTMARREEALDRWESLRLWQCPIEQRRAAAEGKVLIGEVTDSTDSHVTITSPERGLRFRPGSEVAWLDEDRVRFEITAMHTDGPSGTIIEGTWTAGQKVGLPEVGTQVRFADRRVDDMRSYPGERVKVTPWTHDTAQPPPTLGRPVDSDVLAAAQQMRSVK